MKQIALIAMMLLSSCPCIQAQEKLYTPGKTWIYHNENKLMPCNDYYYKETVVGDTVVNGINATIFYTEILPNGYESLFDHVHGGKGVGYEDNGFIYGITEEDGKVWPIMNFNLHLGDVFYVEAPWYDDEVNDDVEIPAIIIAGERTYCIEGIDRRVLTLKYRDYPDAGEGYWIEGIGSPNLDYMSASVVPTDGSKLYLSECYDGDRLIFSKANWNKLVTGIDDVAADKRRGEAVYDLTGRRVTHPVKGHLYITASKKKVW